MQAQQAQRAQQGGWESGGAELAEPVENRKEQVHRPAAVKGLKRGAVTAWKAQACLACSTR